MSQHPGPPRLIEADRPARPPHRITITVRGYHLDGLQHVNNARYVELLEEARWAMFEERADLDAVLRPDRPALVLVNLNLNYRYPASLRQVLAITTEVVEVGSRKAVFHQEITLAKAGTLVADADLTFVPLDPATGRSTPIEGPLLEFLDSLR